MGLLEEALRATFAAKVAAPPTVEDAAGRAIRGAVRVRRRRITLNTLAVLVTILAVSGAAVALGNSRGRNGIPPADSSSHRAVRLPLDVLADNVILAADGGRIMVLDELPRVTGAVRVPDGWLVTTIADAPGLYYVDPKGETRAIVTGSPAAVSPDGGRVAWMYQGEIYLADRLGARTEVIHKTAAPGGLVPVLITASGAVVLGPGPDAPFGTGHHMWFPAEGRVRDRPLPDADIVGATADGTYLFGTQGLNYPCLRLINPFDGTAKQACDLQLRPDTTVAASPDGRYVMTLLPDRVDVFDLSTVWGYQEPVASWTLPVAAVAWIDGNSLLMGGQGRLLRTYVDEPRRIEEFDVGRAGAPLLPVPVAR
jgi:hypothetical protein